MRHLGRHGDVVVDEHDVLGVDFSERQVPGFVGCQDVVGADKCEASLL